MRANAGVLLKSQLQLYLLQIAFSCGRMCNKNRRKNLSSDRLTNFCSLLWAESRQRKVTWSLVKETRRWLDMATRFAPLAASDVNYHPLAVDV